MIYDILTLLGIVLILFTLFYMANKEKSNTANYLFQNCEKSDLPFINIDVQGHSLNMIADSAAAMSIIREEVLNKLTYEHSSRNISVSALTNEYINTRVVTIPINVNGKEVKTDFLVYAGDDIANYKSHGIVMDGLLGVEFFKATNGMIDFQNQTVKFP